MKFEPFELKKLVAEPIPLRRMIVFCLMETLIS